MMMKRRSLHVFGCLTLAAILGFAQMPAHLSDEQVKEAISHDHGGSVRLSDVGRLSVCNAQLPRVFVYSPSGLLWALNASAKKQFLPFEPKESDTLNALTVIGEGCSGSASLCESITRIVLLSDKHGTVVTEAFESASTSHVWQNALGASSTCASINSKFAMDDVKKVLNTKGEIFIAIFDNARLVYIFQLPGKFIKDLGL